MTISITALESMAALGWRAPEEERLGGWLLRAAGGFTGRANSALAAGDPGRPLAAAVAAVSAWYAARGRPAMICVPYPCGRPHDSALDRYLAGCGWTVRPGAATVMTAPSGPVAAHPGAPGAAVCASPQPDEAWLARYHRGQATLPPVARQVLLSAPWQAFGSVRAGGETIAIGRVAAAGGWAGLTAVEVDPRHRRRGLGLALTARLAALACGQGAGQLYLQVELGNTAARRLYQRAGFTPHHDYHYRVAPAPARLSRPARGVDGKGPGGDAQPSRADRGGKRDN
jgi:N-acetylglutamate synthase